MALNRLYGLQSKGGKLKDFTFSCLFNTPIVRIEKDTIFGCPFFSLKALWAGPPAIVPGKYDPQSRTRAHPDG